MILQGIDHVAITVRDVKASVEWYQSVLGLRRLHEEAWGEYPAVVGIGNTAIALFPARGGGSDSTSRPAVSMRHIAFRASGAAFSLAQDELRRAAIEFSMQDHGISKSIYFPDPDGHEIEITTYELGP